jgi:deazaflavin-dependent oxidoreductase (nitroreductase family)
MGAEKPYFLKPSAFERVANNAVGMLVRLGLGSGHNFVLEVKGRRSGKVYSAPVNLLEYQSRRYLVAPRGETSWVRNARAAVEVSLLKRGRRESYTVREVPSEERPVLLKEYLDRFATTVRRYFPIPKGSPADSFAEIAARYPVFELISKQRPA